MHLMSFLLDVIAAASALIIGWITVQTLQDL
jgi:hypothetical protein